MAHFAKIENDQVIEVIVINNEIICDEDGVEQESLGVEFCKSLFGGDWVQTSFNANFRNKFAALGDKWDGTNFTAENVINEA